LSTATSGGFGARTGGTNSLKGAPSISESEILNVAQQAGSPAASEAGFAQCVYTAGERWGVDPAFLVAWAVQESSFGTAGVGIPSKANNMFGMEQGTRGDPSVTSTTYASGKNTFKKYSSYCDSAKDWTAYIAQYYFPQGLYTPEQIVPIYAPVSDGNDDSAYIATVESLVSQYRQASSSQAAGTN
jgi:flagellum-specific peptidoglycan hydrolase FlgJ